MPVKQLMRWVVGGLSVLVLLLTAIAVTSCASVKPYERGKLAKDKMALERQPEAVLLEQHVYQYREGSAGGLGGAGGGCGCN
jgi:hypothetical protein